VLVNMRGCASSRHPFSGWGTGCAHTPPPGSSDMPRGAGTGPAAPSACCCCRCSWAALATNCARNSRQSVPALANGRASGTRPGSAPLLPSAASSLLHHRHPLNPRPSCHLPGPLWYPLLRHHSCLRDPLLKQSFPAICLRTNRNERLSGLSLMEDCSCQCGVHVRHTRS
jgi:hypothetical protein